MYCGMLRGDPVVEIFIQELESVGPWNLQSGSVCVRRFQKKQSFTVWGENSNASERSRQGYPKQSYEYVMCERAYVNYGR